MTTTTTHFRLPAVFFAITAMVASLLVMAESPASAVHSKEIAISDAYTGTKPFHTECPCDEETGSNPVFKFDVTLTEANTGTPTQPDPGETITVQFTTSERPAGPASADEGTDYFGKAGTVTFTSTSSSTQTIEIEVVGDSIDETGNNGIEFFDVFLFDVQGDARLTDDQGEGGIVDDDPVAPEPAIVIDDVEEFEGDSGTTTFTFTVRLLNAGSGDEYDLIWNTEDGSASSSVTANDYESDGGAVTVSEGTPTATIDVTVNGDTNEEPNETFFVNLSAAPTNPDAPIADDQGQGTILSEEFPTPDLSVNDVSMVEGDSGSKNFTFTLTLDSATNQDVTVEYQTRDATAKVDDNDYAQRDGTATIAEGQTSTTVSVPVSGDTKDENDETFLLRLSNAQGAEVTDGTGEGRILADDPKLSVSDAFAEEPAEGTNGATFTVALSAATDREVTVDYATADGSATAGEDYEAASDTLTFAAGETEKKVVVDVNADENNNEGSETFFLNLSNADGAGIADGQGEGQIGGGVEANAGSDKSGESAVEITFNGGATGGSGSYTFTWDFGDGTAKKTGATVKHRFDETGSFTVTLTVEDSNGDTDSDTATATIDDTGEVDRDSGTNREKTAVDVSSENWTQADTVLLATGYKFPDALAAGPLAQKLDAPLLLTNPNGLPDEVKDELDRLDADKVIILGGAQVVPQSQADELAADGYTVERIAGINRFGTSADIATRVGPTSANEVTVALGQHADPNRDEWPDALSAGSFASLSGPLPALLTHNQFVPQETLDALEDLATEKVFLLGGPVAISDAVEARLEAEGYTVQRVFGDDRYETSVEAAKIAMTRYPAGQVHPVFATGLKYPDGLSGGALAGKVGGPVVLVPRDDLSAAPSVRTFLRDEANRFDVGTVVGGTTVISDNVKTQATSDIIDTT